VLASQVSQQPPPLPCPPIQLNAPKQMRHVRGSRPRSTAAAAAAAVPASAPTMVVLWLAELVVLLEPRRSGGSGWGASVAQMSITTRSLLPLPAASSSGLRSPLSPAPNSSSLTRCFMCCCVCGRRMRTPALIRPLRWSAAPSVRRGQSVDAAGCLVL